MSIRAFAAGQLALELQEKRARIRQFSEIVCSSRTFGLLILQGILNRETHLQTDREQDTKMIRVERILLRLIKREHAYYAVQARLKRNGDHSRRMGCRATPLKEAV